MALLQEQGRNPSSSGSTQRTRLSRTSPVRWLAVFPISKLRRHVFSIRGAVCRRNLVARTDETRTRSSSDDIDVFHGNFTAEAPLGTYQGITEKILSRTPASFRTGACAARFEQTRMAGVKLIAD